MRCIGRARPPPAGYSSGINPVDASAATVGLKAANLIRMAQAGLPVPPGFVLTTQVCADYYERLARRLADTELTELITRAVGYIERATGPILRRPAPPAAGVRRAPRRPGIDARNARHRPQHRPVRHHPARAARRDRRPGLRVGLLPPPHPAPTPRPWRRRSTGGAVRRPSPTRRCVGTEYPTSRPELDVAALREPSVTSPTPINPRSAGPSHRTPRSS